jgi:N-acetylmuramoyl-L-alanine amidase
LQFVLIVALVIATLFTAWTPGESRQSISIETINLATPAPVATSLPTSGPTSTPRLRPLIGIVAGHWGHDSGTVCMDGLTEVSVNQTIATLVQKRLVDLGYDVDLLKEFDTHLTDYQADVLISIHADSCNYVNAQATGYKVAAAMANPQPEKATQLTSCLRARYGQITGLPLHSTSVTIDMTDYHAFSEIDKSTVAAIIETGFLNLDRQFLTDKPDLAAEGIVSGILCYMQNEKLNTPAP